MVDTVADFVPRRFSTKDFDPKERLHACYEAFGTSAARRCCRLSDPSRHLEMTIWDLGRNTSLTSRTGVCVQRVVHTAGYTAQRTSELLTDGNDDISLNIQETGHCVVSQRDRQAVVETGGGFCTSNADVSTVVFSGAARFTSIGLPRKLMMAMVPGVEDALARALPPDTGILRLLARYLDVSTTSTA